MYQIGETDMADINIEQIVAQVLAEMKGAEAPKQQHQLQQQAARFLQNPELLC